MRRSNAFMSMAQNGFFFNETALTRCVSLLYYSHCEKVQSGTCMHFSLIAAIDSSFPILTSS